MPYFLLSILIFAPLAYGTTGPVAQLLVYSSCLLLLLLTALTARRRGGWVRPPGLMLLGGLLVLWLLQLLPLPPALLKIIAPGTAAQYAKGVWLLAPGSWQSLSVNPAATLARGLELCAAGALYCASILLLREPRAIRRLLAGLVGFGGIFATVSILYHLYPNDRILWVLHLWPAGLNQQFGTFVNGNHYATLMGMLLPIALVLFLLNKPTVSYSSWRERLVDLGSDPRTSLHLLYGLAAVMIAVSIFLSLSRGGILSTLGALLGLGLLLMFRLRDARRGGLLAGVVVLVILVVGLFGWAQIFGEFAKLRNQQGQLNKFRTTYWHDSLSLVGDHPLFGTGLGTFADAYSPYQSALTGEKVVDHAHNDYVELATDAGLLGLLLGLGFPLLVVVRSWRALKQRRSREAPLLYCGVLAGLVAVGLHCLVEFSLQIGADLLYAALLLGLLVACATASRRRQGSVPDTRSEGPARCPRLVLGATLLLLPLTIWCFLGAAWAELKFAPIARLDLNKVKAPAEFERLLDISRSAAKMAPLAGHYRFATGNILLAMGRRDEALAAYEQAVKLRPLRSEYLAQTAKLVDFMGQRDLAGRLFHAAVSFAPTRPDYWRDEGDLLLSEGRRSEALHHLSRALELDPRSTQKELVRLQRWHLTPVERSELLPPRTLPYLEYARLLSSQGLLVQAEAAYRKALDYLPSEPVQSASPYLEFAGFLARQKRYPEAQQLVTTALKQFPDNFYLLRASGQFAEQLKLPYQALNAYRKAQLLNPADKYTRQRIEALEKEVPEG